MKSNKREKTLYEIQKEFVEIFIEITKSLWINKIIEWLQKKIERIKKI